MSHHSVRPFGHVPLSCDMQVCSVRSSAVTLTATAAGPLSICSAVEGLTELTLELAERTVLPAVRVFPQ